jgi:hypothetical protein
MTEWNWAIAFNNGFGFYFGMVETQTALGMTESGEQIKFDIGGFELLLPFSCHSAARVSLPRRGRLLCLIINRRICPALTAAALMR